MTASTDGTTITDTTSVETDTTPSATDTIVTTVVETEATVSAADVTAATLVETEAPILSQLLSAQADSCLNISINFIAKSVDEPCSYLIYLLIL